MHIYIDDSSFKINRKAHDYIEKRLMEMRQLMDNPSSAKLKISKEGSIFTCEIILHEAYAKHSSTIKAKRKENYPMLAIKNALSSLKEQLSKQHSKTKDRLHLHKFNNIKLTQQSIKKIFDTENIDEDSFNYELENMDDINIKYCSIKEALVYMELEESHYYLFINMETNRINIIQKNDNGNINIIDTHREIV